MLCVAKFSAAVAKLFPHRCSWEVAVGTLAMDLTFNVLESIRRDVRELRDDLSNEKKSRSRQIEELTKDVKDIHRQLKLNTLLWALAGHLRRKRGPTGGLRCC